MRGPGMPGAGGQSPAQVIPTPVFGATTAPARLDRDLREPVLQASDRSSSVQYTSRSAADTTRPVYPASRTSRMRSSSVAER